MKSKIIIGICVFLVLVASVALIFAAISNINVDTPVETAGTSRNDTEPDETTTTDTTKKPIETVIYIGTTEDDSETVTETDETETEIQTETESQAENTTSSAPTKPEDSGFEGPAAVCLNPVTAKNAFIYVDGVGVVASKGDMNDRIAPASVTKLYAITTALKYVSPSETVTVGEEIKLIGKDSSTARLAVGEKLDMMKLFEAMLLPSGNDASYVLADYVGRNYILKDETVTNEEAVAAFVDAMNENAAVDGLRGTQFKCPDGYDAEGHYTTPNDLIKIAMLSDDCPVILKYVVKTEDTVTLISGQTKTWKNTNSLINPLSEYFRPCVYGLKTGSTDDAGYCLLTLANIEGRTVVIGVFGSTTNKSRFADSVALVDGAQSYLRIAADFDLAA